MQIYESCKLAVQSCLETKTFAVSRLYSDEKTMDIHVHDCYEVYFSISGGKQFLIDNRVYEFSPGDLFFINQYESHYLSQVDETVHERIVLSVHPEYLKKFSTPDTDLCHCFTCRDTAFGNRISLSEEEKELFMYYVHRLSENNGYGQDILDQAFFLELLTCLNRIFLSRCAMETGSVKKCMHKTSGRQYKKMDEILTYINQNLAGDLSIAALSSHFYLSGPYICKIFRDTTGTTANRYITAKRITRAKVLLAGGHSVTETCSLCGFGDYSNFLKTFTKTVGISPKKYSSYTLEQKSFLTDTAVKV